MELQIQKETINVKKRIGEKNKRISIEKDYILPDSKPDIIKVQSESSLPYIRKKENMENRLKIEGGFETRISYITSEGKNRVLKIDEELSEVLDIEGINQESSISEKISIIQIETSILNERKIHYKIEAEIQVVASKKENIELIYEINKVHNIETLSKKTNIDTYIGHSESKISVKEKLETENIQEGIEVVKFKPKVENIETKISYNKILVKADCKIKCVYQSKSGSTYMVQKEVPVMGFLDIENIDEECESNIELTLKNININEDCSNKNEIEIEMEFNLSGDIYQKREINMMIDLYGINYKTDFKNQTMYLEKSKPQVLKKVELENKTLIEDINQIYDQEYIIKNVQTKEEKTEVQIKATYLYSSFENETINKYETIITKELNAKYDLEKTKIKIEKENTVLLPDSSIEATLELSIQSLNAEKIEVINEIEIEDEESDDKYSMIIYCVKEGDSLWKIAKKFKSTVKEISNINEIEDENKINIGDKIYIPRAI